MMISAYIKVVYWVVGKSGKVASIMYFRLPSQDCLLLMQG